MTGSLKECRDRLFADLKWLYDVQLNTQKAGIVEAVLEVPRWWMFTLGIRQYFAMKEFEWCRYQYLPIGVRFNIKWKYGQRTPKHYEELR